MLLPHVMRSLAGRMPERMSILSSTMGGDAPDRVQRLIATLGLPRHISAYGVGEAELRRAAEELADKHSAEELLGIYRSAL